MQTDFSPTVRQTDNFDNKRTPFKVEFNAATATIPLRLFLGISFIVAAFDKISDPEFFDSKAFGYIGNQLSGFAAQSPIGGFLLNVAVPNATLFGWSVLLGELAVGLGTLVGLFSRTAAFFGFVLSLTLWLSTSWSVAPFFLGPDLPYAIGWLTLCLAGAPAIFSLDWQLKNFLQARKAQAGAIAATSLEYTTKVNAAAIARRNFIIAGGGTLLVGAITGVALYNSLASKKAATNGNATQPTPGTAASATVASATPANTVATATTSAATTATTQAPTSQAQTTQATTAANTTAAPVVGTILATLVSLPAGKAKAFTTPDSNEKAILVHNDDGTVCALSSICTHQGCTVDYNASSHVLACPCHGAQFNAKTGEPLKGPATRALKSFKVQVDASGNIIYSQA